MYTQAVKIWFDFYRFHTQEEYVFSAKDGLHLKQLLKKIETKVRQKSMDITEENILNSLRGFLSSLNDQWILNHLEISIVNSKFNVLYAAAVKHSPFTKSDRINEIIRNKYGSDPTGTTG